MLRFAQSYSKPVYPRTMTAYRQIINYGVAQELLVSCRKSRQKAVTKQIQDKLLAFYGLLPNTQLVLLQAKQAPHRHHTA